MRLPRFLKTKVTPILQKLLRHPKSPALHPSLQVAFPARVLKEACAVCWKPKLRGEALAARKLIVCHGQLPSLLYQYKDGLFTISHFVTCSSFHHNNFQCSTLKTEAVALVLALEEVYVLLRDTVKRLHAGHPAYACCHLLFLHWPFFTTISRQQDRSNVLALRVKRELESETRYFLLKGNSKDANPPCSCLLAKNYGASAYALPSP